MYDLVIANKNYSTWSLRPWLLMKALDIPFTEKLVPFPDHLRGFHPGSPTGMVPCLIDGEIVVWESLAIVEYLAERHANVWPSEANARTWARCAAAEMHAGFAVLRQRCSNSCGVRAKLRDMPPALTRDIARIDQLWNEGLERFGGPWLAGATFTAVDAFFAPIAFRVQTYGLTLSERAASYAKQLLALPAMQDWYAAGLAETWREPDHEDEIARSAIVVEDLRAR
jgi:glutathione S-transferase